MSLVFLSAIPTIRNAKHVYGSNSLTIPSSHVKQGIHERILGRYLGFVGRNMVYIELSRYGPSVSTIPPSDMTKGESRGSVIDR